MKKYMLYLLPSENDRNYDQHKLIGTAHGLDIYGATHELVETVLWDLFERPESVGGKVFACPPEEASKGTWYQYKMCGILSTSVTEESTIIPYGVVERSGD